MCVEKCTMVVGGTGNSRRCRRGPYDFSLCVRDVASSGYDEMGLGPSDKPDGGLMGKTSRGLRQASDGKSIQGTRDA